MTTKEIQEILKNALGNPNAQIEFAENLANGDFTTNIALQEKQEGESPIETAKGLVEKLQNDAEVNRLIQKIEVAGPGFINFWIKEDVLIELAKNVSIPQEEIGQIWAIEHTSPNPNKAMHLGHLRNNVTGMAIANLHEAIGATVIRDCIDNNRGIAIAKLMWGYLKFARRDLREDKTDVSYWAEHKEEWTTPEEVKKRPDRFIDELYTKAAMAIEEDKTLEPEVRDLVVRWENEEKIVWDLWKLVLSYSYEGQEMTLKRLGNKYDKVWHEDEHYKEGKTLVEEGLKKGIFVKSKEGTIITNLKDFNLPDTVVIKSDGTALYITQDLALTRLKRQTFHATKLCWVIGPDQSLAMKQLFAVCEQLGIGKVSDFEHIAFGYMSIKGQGKMSSRKGNVIYIDELLDEAKEKVKAKITNEDIKEEEKDVLAEQIAVGAVKYSILKIGRFQDTAFDIDESISFDGDSGPYLQYTYARTQSILKKGENSQKEQSKEKKELNEEELAIMRHLSRYQDTIVNASIKYSPNTLCKYLYDLAKKYNEFYQKHKIVGSDNEEFRKFLTKEVGKRLEAGLHILGIQTPEKM
jgi:arginyl-tRNA synthetase